MYNDSDYITESTSDTETDTELEATTDAKTEAEHSDEDSAASSESSSNTDSDDGCDSKIHPMDHHSKTASATSAVSAAAATKHKIILFDISEEEFHDLQETIYSVTQVIQKQGRESPAEKTFNFYRVHHMRIKNQNLWEMSKSTKKI